MSRVDALAQALRGGDAVGVRAVLAGASEGERRACRPAVEAVRKEQPSRYSVEAFHAGRQGLLVSQALVVARLGVEGGAAAAAGLLRREESRWRGLRELVVGVLLDRSPPWLPDLVARLAESDEEQGEGTDGLVEELRLAAGLPRPTGAPYLRRLAGHHTYRRWGRDEAQPDLEGALRSDATFRAVVPELLTVPDIGEVLRVRDADSVRDPATGRYTRVPRPVGETWGGVLTGLARDGLLDRERLLDLTLGALLRDGKRDHHGWFVAFHGLLAPTPEEAVARVRAYVGVLADGPAAAATVAQQTLRAVDDAGRLDPDTLLDVTRAALARPEKGVATRQLGWVERAARRDRASVPQLALAVGDGLAHERRDVQERVLTALERLDAVAPLPPSAVEELRGQAADLPVALRDRAGLVLGGDMAARPVDDGPRGEVVPLPGPLPRSTEPRVADLPELAEVTAAWLESGDLLAAERVADGIAALGARDRDALTAALAPLAERLRPASAEREGLDELARSSPLRAALYLLAARPAPPPVGRLGRLLRRDRDVLAVRWPAQPGPEGALSGRLQELVRAVDAGDAGRLLAYPARPTGATDPEEVVDGVERAARDGRVPWPRDLEQAWLRLPRETVEAPDARLLDRLGRCPGPAASWLRGRLAGGPAPDPRVDAAEVPRGAQRWGHAIAVPLGGAPVVALTAPAWASPSSDSLVEQVYSFPDLPRRAALEWWEGRVDGPLAALLALPSHREVAAAHLVATLVDTEHRLAEGTREALVLLPEAGGPTGAATHLALGYAAAHSDPATRTAAVDALDGFGLLGGLDAAAAGAALGALLLRDQLKVGRVAGVLAEVTRGPRPAQQLVWDLLAAALPALLPSGRRGVAELVTVAADAAAAVGARGLLSGLEAAAGLSGTSRLVAESRRLRDVLAARPGGAPGQRSRRGPVRRSTA